MPNTAGGILMGMILQWSGSIATIPTGWQLSDGSNGSPDLRDKFILGAYSAVSNPPGTIGGAWTHSHTANGGFGGSLAPGSAIVNSTPSGNYQIAVSGGFSETIGPYGALPTYYSLAYIYAKVTGAIPAGAILLWSGSIASIPADYQLCLGTNGTPDLRDKFVIGSGITFGVGASGGEVNHNHNKAFGGFVYLAAGPQIVNNYPSGTIQNGGSYSGNLNLSQSASLPPYFALAYIQNISGASRGSYTGFIVAWSGSIATIPSGWRFCNGTLSPDLRNRFVVGAGTTYAVNATGGATTHAHSLSVSGTFELSEYIGLEHIVSGGGTYAKNGIITGGGSVPATESMPPYYSLAYILKE